MGHSLIQDTQCPLAVRHLVEDGKNGKEDITEEWSKYRRIKERVDAGKPSQELGAWLGDAGGIWEEEAGRRQRGALY
jgi:hypothetical protein